MSYNFQAFFQDIILDYVGVIWQITYWQNVAWRTVGLITNSIRNLYCYYKQYSKTDIQQIRCLRPLGATTCPFSGPWRVE